MREALRVRVAGRGVQCSLRPPVGVVGGQRGRVAAQMQVVLGDPPLRVGAGDQTELGKLDEAVLHQGSRQAEALGDRGRAVKARDADENVDRGPGAD